MMDVTWVTDDFAVSGQVFVDQVPAVATAGFKTLINNRPDHESDDQPAGERVGAAAESQGLAYAAIPLRVPELSKQHVDAMQQALTVNLGPTLGFCRTGTRSYMLWALVQLRQGADMDELIDHAADRGFDIAGLRKVAGL